MDDLRALGLKIMWQFSFALFNRLVLFSVETFFFHMFPTKVVAPLLCFRNQKFWPTIFYFMAK